MQERVLVFILLFVGTICINELGSPVIWDKERSENISGLLLLIVVNYFVSGSPLSHREVLVSFHESGIQMVPLTLTSWELHYQKVLREVSNTGAGRCCRLAQC